MSTVEFLPDMQNVKIMLKRKSAHYENTPIQIYWKIHHQKVKVFRYVFEQK